LPLFTKGGNDLDHSWPALMGAQKVPSVRVQAEEPPPKALIINNLQHQPNRSIELPQRKSLI